MSAELRGSHDVAGLMTVWPDRVLVFRHGDRRKLIRLVLVLSALGVAGLEVLLAAQGNLSWEFALELLLMPALALAGWIYAQRGRTEFDLTARRVKHDGKTFPLEDVVGVCLWRKGQQISAIEEQRTALRVGLILRNGSPRVAAAVARARQLAESGEPSDGAIREALESARRSLDAELLLVSTAMFDLSGWTAAQRLAEVLAVPMFDFAPGPELTLPSDGPLLWKERVAKGRVLVAEAAEPGEGFQLEEGPRRYVLRWKERRGKAMAAELLSNLAMLVVMGSFAFDEKGVDWRSAGGFLVVAAIVTWLVWSRAKTGGACEVILEDARVQLTLGKNVKTADLGKARWVRVASHLKDAGFLQIVGAEGCLEVTAPLDAVKWMRARVVDLSRP